MGLYRPQKGVVLCNWDALEGSEQRCHVILTCVLKDSPGCYSENRLSKGKSGNREAEII